MLLLADYNGPLARRVWSKVETFWNKQVADRILYYVKEVSFPSADSWKPINLNTTSNE
jgi:hypothetical protein